MAKTKRDATRTMASSRKSSRRNDLEVVEEYPEILSAEESEDDEAAAVQPVVAAPDDGVSIRLGRGDTFAARVFDVIEHIPPSKVAAYGQVAALAGMPRNARQVGHLLADGLTRGTTAPWWRVINSAGKISLPRDGAGGLQRQRLESEGVTFKESGTVPQSCFWNRSQPFFSEPLPVGWQ